MEGVSVVNVDSQHYIKILYEDDGILIDRFKIYNRYYNELTYFKVDMNLDKQFIIIRTNYDVDNTMIIIHMSDTFEDAENFIKNDVCVRTVVLPTIECYMIIDMIHIVICFNGIKIERNFDDTPCCYQYFSYQFK